MNILLKSATIIDPTSVFHNTIQDVLIKNGTIVSIQPKLKNAENYKEVQLKNLHISRGWFDSSVCFGEPGYEERETIANGLLCAAKSGFTSVALNSNTNPVIDTSATLTFVTKAAQNNAVELVPYGALTKNSSGKQLAELYDMQKAGACAFSDYSKSIKNPNLLKIALQYASNFKALICSYPQDANLALNGVVNEGNSSTKLGLKGIPSIAETLQIQRDLELLSYTKGKIHIPTISTAKSVALIREAKNKKLDISCSVALANLVGTDSLLETFNTNYKVLPPLRTQEDVTALQEGVLDGTIDMVTSNHNPLNIELKNVEFDLAAFGTIGLECMFGILNQLFTTKQAITLLTRGKERFGIQSTTIAEGNKANLSLFNPIGNATFSSTKIRSKSTNCMFTSTPIKGVVYGIYANKKLIVTN